MATQQVLARRYHIQKFCISFSENKSEKQTEVFATFLGKLIFGARLCSLDLSLVKAGNTSFLKDITEGKLVLGSFRQSTKLSLTGLFVLVGARPS